MPADAQTLRTVFQNVNSGDIERGRNLLIAASDGNATLEALCLKVREFGLPPEDARYATGFLSNCKKHYPNSSAWVALGFVLDSAAWTEPNDANRYLQNEKKEPAKGPFEAAARLYAHVACCNWRVIKNHTAANFRPTHV